MVAPTIKYDFIMRGGNFYLPSLHHVKTLNKSGLFQSNTGVAYPQQVSAWRREDINLIFQHLIRLREHKDKSDVLIAADLFWEAEPLPFFRRILKEIYDQYKYVIHFVKEPMYGELARRMGSYSSITGKPFVKIHESFLETLEPDLVGYASPVEIAKSPAKDTFLWTMMVDSFIENAKPLPPKTRDFFYGGQSKGWAAAYSNYGKVGTGRGRGGFFKDFFKEIKTFPEEISFDYKLATYHDAYPLSFNQISEILPQYNYQIDAPNGYHFHFVRNLQSLFCGTIPFVGLSNRYEQEFMENTKDWPIKEFENCIFCNEDNIREKVKKAIDPDLIEHMNNNIYNMDKSFFSTETLIKNIHTKTRKALDL